MELLFPSPVLHRLCNRQAELNERLGAEGARMVAQCLHELEAADTLGTAAALPHLAIDPESADGITVKSGKAVKLLLQMADAAERGVGDDWRSATRVHVLQLASGSMRIPSQKET